jgi:hypothetical protein
VDTVRIQAKIKYATLVVGVALSVAVALTFYFILIPVSEPNRAKQAVEVFGIGAGLVTLVYAAMTVHQMYDSASAAAARERVRYSADLVSQWHSPDMVVLTLIGFKLRTAARAQPNNDVLELIRREPDGEKAIVCIFNYFEKVALSIEYGIADEPYLRDFFASTVSGYHHDVFAFVQRKRSEARTTKIFDKFEEMAKRWEQTQLKSAAKD